VLLDFFPSTNDQRIVELAMAETKKLDKAPEWLPVLIIPGFMSSGLEIKKSKIWPEGKRIWLNLGSLGLSAMYFGTSQKKKDIAATTDTSDIPLNKEEEE
jgi:hypothetical protein